MYPVEHIRAIMLKILQAHLLCAFVANLKIGAIYALYPERFCDKHLAVRKVFAFSDSASPFKPQKYSFWLKDWMGGGTVCITLLPWLS